MLSRCQARTASLPTHPHPIPKQSTNLVPTACCSLLPTQTFAILSCPARKLPSPWGPKRSPELRCQHNPRDAGTTSPGSVATPPRRSLTVVAIVVEGQQLRIAAWRALPGAAKGKSCQGHHVELPAARHDPRWWPKSLDGHPKWPVQELLSSSSAEKAVGGGVIPGAPTRGSRGQPDVGRRGLGGQWGRQGERAAFGRTVSSFYLVPSEKMSSLGSWEGGGGTFEAPPSPQSTPSWGRYSVWIHLWPGRKQNPRRIQAVELGREKAQWGWVGLLSGRG